MNRSRYGASPVNNGSPKFVSRSAISPRSYRNSGSGDGSPLLQKNNSSFVQKRSSRLDPQVYTDTQSRGLTSRLASYYEQERLNVKPIVNRLYNKAGDLPIVHFHKNELTNSPRNSSMTISTVRIPPPDKSTYQSNMRSEILRTGSIVGNNTGLLMHNASDPNPDTSYEVMAPLDALKEISRKRIHCDETNISGRMPEREVERVKKQRADVLTASPHQIQFVPVSKRQRDTTSPTYKQISLEMQKKRPCTKNNEVLSSLSSSARYAAITNAIVSSPKQKPDMHCVVPHTQPEINAVDSLVQSKETEAIENVPKRLEKPVAPPESPSKPNATKLTLFNKRYATVSKPSLDLDMTQSNEDDDDDCNNGISFVKPKAITSEKVGTTKRPVESSKLALMLSCLSGDLDEEDQVDAVEEATPKRSQDSTQHVSLNPQKTSEMKPNTEENTTSALGSIAPTLLGFKMPEVSAKPVTGTPTTIQNASVAQTSVTATIVASTSSALPSSTSIVPSVVNTQSVSITTTTKIATTLSDTVAFSKSVTKPTENPSFSFGSSSNVTPVSSVASTAVVTVPSFSLGSETEKSTSTPPPTFSFGIGASSKPNPAFEAKKSTNMTLPTFGSTITDQTTKPIVTTQPILPFRTINTLTTVPSKPALLNTPTNAQIVSTTSDPSSMDKNPSSAFSFGSSNKPAATGGGFSFKPTEPTAKPSENAFSFGSALGSTVQSSNTPTIAPPPAFGSSQPNNQPSFGAASSANMFGTPSATGTTVNGTQGTVPSYGSSNTVAAPLFGTTKPVTTSPNFGATNNSTPVFGSSTILGTVPSFGSPSTIAAAPSFGTPANTTAAPTFGTPSTTAAAPSFGSFSTTTPSSVPKPGGFSFGGLGNTPSFGSTSTPAAPSAFGSMTTSANAPSFFGSSTATNSTTPAFGSTTVTPSFGGLAPTSMPSTFGSTPLFGNSAATSTFGSSTPSFGTPTPATFGASTAQSFGNNTLVTPAFGSSTAPPSFGMAPATPAFGTSVTSTAAPVFGSSTPTFGSSSLSFGSTAAAAPFGATDHKPAPPAFGATSSASNFFGSPAPSNATAAPKPFAFGASANTTVAPPAFGGNSTPVQPSAFAFGSTNTPVQPAPGAFNFGPSNGTMTNNPAPSAGSPFNFGGTDNNAPSAFGSGMASKIPVATQSFGMAPTATPFAFASSAPVSAQPSTGSPFAFNSGSSSNTGSASSTGGAFNFNAGTQQDFGVNLFSATAANGSSNSAKIRPIRQATRRINK